jgi:signal transduction histidine kinase
MIAAWSVGPSTKAPDVRAGPETRWWLALAVLLALASLWELFGLENWLGERARAMARAGDFYYSRALVQKLVISAAVAAMVLLLPFIQRTRSSNRLVLVAFALYVAISAVNLVSLHAIDKVADLSWHGMSLVQALKLGCSAMIVQGVRIMRRID